ncbi:MAG: hypothetical protein KQ78_00889 [Candidatus Izimaplasma bacterium HR2]|nr:MAG: hypothetical protein KQ78_00889 [Candidatus Izimaplasma bacterium HR2]
MKLQYILKIGNYLGLILVSFILTTKLFYGLNSNIQLIGTILIVLIMIIISFLLKKVTNSIFRLGSFYLMVIIATVAYTPYLVRIDTIDTPPLLEEKAYFPHDVGLYVEGNDYNDLFEMKINDDETEIIFLTSSGVIELFDIVNEEFFVFDLYESSYAIDKNDRIITYHFFEDNILVSVTKGNIYELVLIDIKDKKIINNVEISLRVVELIENEIYMTASDTGYKFTLNSDLTMVQMQVFDEEISYAANVEDGFLVTYKYENGYSDTLIYSDTFIETDDNSLVIQSTTVKHNVQVLYDSTIVINTSTPSYMELDFLEFVEYLDINSTLARYDLDYVGSNNIVVQSDFTIQTDGEYYYISMGWPMYKDIIYIKEDAGNMAYYDDVFFYQQGEGIRYNMGLVVTNENIYFLSHDGLYYLQHTEDFKSYSYIFPKSLFYASLFTLPLFTLGKAKVRDNSTDFRYNRSNYDTHKMVDKNKAKKREKW